MRSKTLTTFNEKLVANHMGHQNMVAERSMAKYRAMGVVNTIANRCMELIGGFASDEQCPIVREWRDMRVLTILGGTNEVMKGIIAKSLSS